MARSVSSPLLGLVCLAVGVALVSVAAGLLPSAPDAFAAPRWVLGACGGVFVLGGVAVTFAGHAPIRLAAALTLVLGLGLVGGWVALVGAADGVSGGLPFVPDALNVALARGVFGGGALVCLALFGWGVSRLARGLPVE